MPNGSPPEGSPECPGPDLGDLAARVVAALTAGALWALAFLGPRAVQPVDELALVIGRYVVFAACGLVVLARKRARLKLVGRRLILLALHLGVVGYIGFFLFIAYAVTLAGGVVAAVVTGIIPLAAAVIGNLREAIVPWRRVLGPVMLAVSGLVVLNLGRTPAAGFDGAGDRTAIGFFLALAACGAWTYFVSVNAAIQQGPSAPADTETWTALIGLGAGLGSLMLVPVAAVTSNLPALFDWSIGARFVGWSILLGFVGSWCATALWVWGARGLPATLMAQLISAESLFGAAFSLLWEQRPPTWPEIGGAVLVVAGVSLGISIFAPRRSSGRTMPTAERTATAHRSNIPTCDAEQCKQNDSKCADQ